MDPKKPETKTESVMPPFPPLDLGELAQRSVMSPEIVEFESPDGAKGQFALVPTVETNGRASMRLESIAKLADEYRDKPRRRMGTANLADLPSLVAHINRFKDADSAIFADTSRGSPSITAVLDYHRAGADKDPRFGQHRSRYAFPISDEWKAWTDKNGEPMGQADFAEFIETHIVDVADPSVAGETAKSFADKCGVVFAPAHKLLELSRGLSINVGGKVANQVNLQSGEKQIVFEETHSDAQGQPLKVPGAFLIGIPVFRADARYQVCVRLRYRKEGGALVWTFDLWRHEEVFDAAILQACETVKTGTGLPLMVGTPE